MRHKNGDRYFIYKLGPFFYFFGHSQGNSVGLKKYEKEFILLTPLGQSRRCVKHVAGE
jgi:hypothetical protein